jgi:hypothetical protein
MKRPLFLILVVSAAFLIPVSLCVGCGSSRVAGTGGAQTGETIIAGVSGSTSATLSPPSTSPTTATLGAPSTSLQSTTTTEATTTTTTEATTTTKTTLGPPPVQTTVTTGSWTKLTVDIGPLVTIDPWTLFQETDPHMQWSGPWLEKSSPKADKGAYCAVADPASVLIRFTGQRISFQAMKDSAAGIAKLTLDGSHVYTVDLYAEGFSSQMAWLSDPLPKGTHTVLIEWTGTKNPANVYTTDFITFDYVAVYGGTLLNP